MVMIFTNAALAFATQRDLHHSCSLRDYQIFLEASDKVIEQPSQEDAPGNEHHDPNSVAVKQTERMAERLASIRGIEPGQGYAPMQLAPDAKVRDANPWLLGTKQGVIDLRTSSLRSGLPDDHIRAIIPTRWKGLDEPAPRFAQFLQELFADRKEAEREELIAFLQRALGYGITGHANARIFLMFYGKEGYNGKRTLLRILEHTLGKMVVMLPKDALLAGGRFSTFHSAHSRLGHLQGKRIAWTGVSDQNARFDSKQINLLTSGEPIIARRLYGKTFAFTPSHLLLLLTTHKPEVDSPDSAFWERLCLIPFNMRFVAHPEQPNERQCDARLAQALEAEASGILAWLVRGAREWMHLGLAIPESVRQPNLESNKEKDPVADFVNQCCILDPDARARAGVLYKHYQAWAEEHGHITIDSKQFGQELKQIAQVIRQHKKHGDVYLGIRFNVEKRDYP